VIELSSFYENTFGHVPLRAINAAWFQWVMHPKYSSCIPPAKRMFDVCVASLLALVTSPIVAILALLVKLDGGSALYRQIRIGEGGKPFSVLKLRSMRVAQEDTSAQWCTADDDRVTSLGRFLRRSHLDELPQLLNVIKGDMSIVGPRPEQPSFVERLEESVPFYNRRHVVRPGITGWAQVRCGYAGSHEGTLWKLSHDLYYLKHRSTAFDLLILGETLHMLFADTQFPTEFSLPTFVHRAADPAASQIAATQSPVD
jgi:lipopolysaccharide/colanic/teichoic acid biosynthesis glycosyltransferase